MIQRKFTAGFTLFEMLISVAIIIIVSGVVFYNHNQFESDTELTNLAYQVALSVREAQVKSISVRQYGGSFRVPYGIHLSKARPEEYILFADLDSNGIYTSGDDQDDMLCSTGTGSECLEKVTLGRDNYIEGWRGILWVDDQQEVYGGASNSVAVDFLDIKFQRPDPDAIFGAYFEAGAYAQKQETLGYCGGDECTGWAICLKSPDEQRKQVIVYNTGQISVESAGSDSNAVCLQ